METWTQMPSEASSPSFATSTSGHPTGSTSRFLARPPAQGNDFRRSFALATRVTCEDQCGMSDFLSTCFQRVALLTKTRTRTNLLSSP